MIRVGSIVFLKSEPKQLMTVSELLVDSFERDQVRCRWFRGSNAEGWELREGCFFPDELHVQNE